MRPPPGRSGLAEMVAGALHDGASHLVLADWLEENLDRADVAAVLRASTTDPRKGKQHERTTFDECRTAPLDGEVSATMCQWKVGQLNLYDPAVFLVVRQGYLIVLCVSPESEIGLRRWVRWLEHRGEPTREVHALWERLGAANVTGEELLK